MSKSIPKFDYINRAYAMNVKIGQRVIAYGKPGVVAADRGNYIGIRLDGEKHINNYHPTDGLEWPDLQAVSHD